MVDVKKKKSDLKKTTTQKVLLQILDAQLLFQVQPFI